MLRAIRADSLPCDCENEECENSHQASSFLSVWGRILLGARFPDVEREGGFHSLPVDSEAAGLTESLALA